MKVLVVAHGHPDFGPGGGELAAYAQFQALRLHRGVSEARFLARTGEPRLPPGAVACLRTGEHLIRRDIVDWPLLSAAPDAAPTGHGLASFLESFAPDVVLVHHVAHLGLDILAQVRAVLPRAGILLTLHDYLGICRNQGLMVTRPSRADASPLAGKLCNGSGAEPCGRCFPDDAPSIHDERLARFRAAFAAVDAFVAPSRFLADRYAGWGLEADRLHVIDNGVSPPTRPMEPPAFGRTLHLGFFGQARPTKGLHIALAALHHLNPALRSRVRLDLNISRLEAQEGWYRHLIDRLLAPLLNDGVVRSRGPYGRDDLSERMSDVDAVLVPSTWWENAPLVIGEALSHGRPIIGSRIGGIAEKVEDGVDGLLFEPGNPVDLSAVVSRLLQDATLGRTLAAGAGSPLSVAASAASHLELIHRLAKRPPR